MGSPKDIRKKLYEDKNYDVFFQDYRIHANENLDTVVEVMNIVEDTESCLLCFEKDYKKCHRSILASMMMNYSDRIDMIVNI